jgi:hypothetical protein
VDCWDILTLAPTQPILASYGATLNYNMEMYKLQPIPVHETYYFFNMHQTMKVKDNKDGGTVHRYRQQHPPPRKVSRVFNQRQG